MKQQGAELLEYFAHYCQAQTDRLKLSGRKLLLRVEMEIVGVLVVTGSILVAITLAFIGVAQGLGQLFDGQVWLGYLSAGLLLGVCVALTVGAALAWRDKNLRDRTIDKYEQRKRQQQDRFGHSVSDRVADRPPPK